MLSFNIISLGESVSVGAYTLCLTTEKQVREAFLHCLEKDRHAFMDEVSAKLIREYAGNYTRTSYFSITGEDGVEKIITSLSARLQLALVIANALQSPDERILVDLRAVGDYYDDDPIILERLSELVDGELFISFSAIVDLLSPYLDNSTFRFFYNGSEIGDFQKWQIDNGYFTTKCEEIGFRQLQKDVFFTFLPEGIRLGEFYKLFPAPYGEFYTATVNKYLNDPESDESRYIVRADHGIFNMPFVEVRYPKGYSVLEKDGSRYCHYIDDIEKLPEYPDIIEDVLEDFHKTGADKMTVIVTTDFESQLADDYSGKVIIGFIIDEKAKTIDILTPQTAAIMYHQALRNAELPENGQLSEHNF